MNKQHDKRWPYLLVLSNGHFGTYDCNVRELLRYLKGVKAKLFRSMVQKPFVLKEELLQIIFYRTSK